MASEASRIGLSLTDLDRRGMGVPVDLVRGALKGALVVAVLAVLGVVGGVVFLKAQAARAQRIDAAGGIEDARFLRIGGRDEWITIRGWDRRNPLLLVIPDAPGASSAAFIDRFRPWERRYTIVQWDPPGAGRTLTHAGFRQDGAGPSAAAEAADAAAVIAYAASRTGQARAIILSGGYGAGVALRLSRTRPDLVAAVIAIGPWTAPRAVREAGLYAQMRQFAGRAGDDLAVGDLARLGPPPWTDDAHRRLAARLIAGMLETDGPRWDSVLYELVIAPHWTPLDVVAYYAGPRAGEVRARTAREDPADVAPVAGAPVLMIQPTHDSGSPTDLGLAWFDRLQAPQRAYWRMPEAGHAYAFAHNGELLDRIDDHVRLWGLRNSTLSQARPGA